MQQWNAVIVDIIRVAAIFRACSAVFKKKFATIFSFIQNDKIIAKFS